MPLSVPRFRPLRQTAHLRTSLLLPALMALAFAGQFGAALALVGLVPALHWVQARQQWRRVVVVLS